MILLSPCTMNRSLQLFCLLLIAPAIFAQHIKLTRTAQPNDFTYGGVGTEDPNGYMWFASQSGVLRYDGYNFVTFVNDPQDANSLANNKIETIFASRDSSIWIGTDNSGLDRL